MLFRSPPIRPSPADPPTTESDHRNPPPVIRQSQSQLTYCQTEYQITAKKKKKTTIATEIGVKEEKSKKKKLRVMFERKREKQRD